MFRLNHPSENVWLHHWVLYKFQVKLKKPDILITPVQSNHAYVLDFCIFFILNFFTAEKPMKIHSSYLLNYMRCTTGTWTETKKMKHYRIYNSYQRAFCKKEKREILNEVTTRHFFVNGSIITLQLNPFVLQGWDPEWEWRLWESNDGGCTFNENKRRTTSADHSYPEGASSSSLRHGLSFLCPNFFFCKKKKKPWSLQVIIHPRRPTAEILSLKLSYFPNEKMMLNGLNFHWSCTRELF